MNKFSLLITCFVFINSTSLFAEMYKSVDADGNISYSDQPPFKGAKTLIPPHITTTPAVKVPEKKAETKKTEEKTTTYSLFQITSPQNDETIWDNNGNVTVSMSIKPALDTAKGHYISILIGGKEVQKQPSTTISLSNIDRGSHQISAVIKDKNNKTLRRAKTIPG